MFKFFLFICSLFLSVSVFSQQRAPWHHSASPYRACYSYAGGELPAQTGVLFEVPVCGIGHPEGKDVYCYDDRGRQVLIQPVGAGRQNQAVLLCRPEANARNLYAYFGSGSNAPAARIPYWGGLLCEIRTLPEGESDNWKQASALLEKSRLLAVFPIENPTLVCNPFNSQDHFIAVIQGFLNFPQGGTRTYFVAADDAGYLLINQELQVERNGRNYVYSSLRGEFRKELTFPAGVHRMDLVGINFAGDFVLALGQLPGGNRVANVTANAFLKTPKTEFVTTENKYADRANPTFQYRHLSYMAIGERMFTETELSTYSGAEAKFEFGDGIELRGKAVRRIFSNLERYSVKVTVKRDVATGYIDFPELAPLQRLQADTDKQYQQYFTAINSLNLQNIKDTDSLLGYLEFLLRREFCPEQVPVCERLLKMRRLPAETERLALQSLARAAALREPEKAAKAYIQLLENATDRKDLEGILLESMDFAIFRMRDYRLAERWLNQYGRRLRRNSKVGMLRFDLALQQGDINAARRHYQELLDNREYADARRATAVQGNALRERIGLLLEEGQLLESWKALHELALTDPQSRGNGSFSLLRAQLFQKLNWLPGALGELEGAILFEPILPNLPDIEFQRAEIYAAAGEKAKAEELYRKIATEYPNHPMAESARRKIGK
ncbi:MAG: FCD domain-containing protein [Lentisphaerae bacterium]|jgi:tetratricopeptide (TPR) repeat protein|nr:FCD domain-containing protein [Lentisphaerota bacterium]